ncbi:MAG: aminodeoxychorismate synthase component I [Candidatus Omnitrophota bacterium]
MIEKLNLEIPPASVYDRLRGLPYSFFLDSALPSQKLGRFSFIGIEPFLIFKSKKDRITLDWITKREELRGNPFIALKKLFGRFRTNPRISHIPFTGGGVGYFSYDLKDFNEPCLCTHRRGKRLPERAIDDINIPDCIFCFYDTVLAFDHSRREFFAISTQKERLERLKNRIRTGTGLSSGRFSVGTRPVPVKTKLESNFTKDSYIRAVERAKEYIKAGDIYQVNLSQRFKVTLNTDPFDLYKILRTINPAPFACFLNFADVKIVSASPERFLKKEARCIETRPIKGTRPRGGNPSEDATLKKELIASAKDRAENLMIIDLERNDLGRICEYGSVRVSEFMACEEYATVFHLVSTVEGRLREDVSAVDCLINCFPGGSITGAPKIRSMEIIEELEPVKRSIYTGSIGYIGFDGNMDTSIVIRTFIIKGNTAYFHVGGGIVYDSDPEKEYQETLDKAKALIEAISYETGLPKQKAYSLT